MASPWQALVAMLLFQGFITIFLLGCRSSLNLPAKPLPYTKHPGGKVHVLLLSSWRSGSSFLGQVFSQNPSVFYLMEPGWHVWTTLRRPGARTLHMPVRDLLRSVFQCDFSALKAYTPPGRKVSHLFMWTQSRALCSPPTCPSMPRDAMNNEKECHARCVGSDLDTAQLACQTYSHVVLKEVRLFSLEPLYPLLRDPTLDLRIIHLVRDPRAVARSRERSVSSLMRDNALVLELGDTVVNDAQYKVLQAVCRSHVHIHQTAMLRSPDFLRNRYHVVRYEDVVRDPLSEVEKLYRFTGLTMTPQLQSWILNLTQGNGQGRYAFQISSRDASQVSQAWRSQLAHSKVQHVQRVCRDAMALLGYRPVCSEAEQKHLGLELLLSPSSRDFIWVPAQNKSLPRWP